MKITLHYFGQLRQVAARDAQTVEVEAAPTLRELLQFVARQHDPAFRRLIFNDRNELSGSLMVLVNDEIQARHLAPPLRDGDRVSLIPPIAGG